MSRRPGGKEVDEATKARIADLYQNTKMSIGWIAAALNVSMGTVRKYKDHWVPQQRLK